MKFFFVQWIRSQPPTIAEQALNLPQVITCASVYQGMSPAGIVSHHSANHATVGSGGFRTEKQVRFLPASGSVHPEQHPAEASHNPASGLISRIRVKYFETSTTIPFPTTCPASDVPAVRGISVVLFSAA